MKRIALGVFILLLGAAAHAATIDGYWEGVGQIPNDEMKFSIVFTTGGSGVAGVIDIPDTASSGLPLADVSVDGAKVKFTLTAGGMRVPFEGRLSGDSIRGNFQFGPHSVPFSMHRTTPPKQPYDEEQITYTSGTVTLRGSLLLPRTNGPHPVVIFQNAARRVTRDYWRFYADQFTRAGVASLIYDQRADSTQVGFEQFAADTLAAIDYLKTRDDIDEARIGLTAASQGAWVAPIVATRSKDIAFVIVISAPAVTMAENIQWESESKLRDARVPAEEIPAALALKKEVMEKIRTGAPDDEIDALIATQKDSWARAIGLPARNDWMRRWFPLVLAYDPVPDWEKVAVPVLAVYGERDQSVRVATSAPRLEQALRNNRDATIKVYPNANHGILVTAPQGRPRLAAGYIRLMTDWLQKRVVRARKAKD
jgi:uncharacterized protein